MDGGTDDELEYTLLNKRDVLVYQIPPASSSAGHKADDWKRCIWRGRCRIAGKGQDLTIKMLDPSSGQLFAQCLIPNGAHEKYVERVVDSSRYFVLKITNGQRHAFIGLGFEDRNDAFDFNCTLSDFKSTWVDRDKQVEELPNEQAPSKDLSLKEGQKITLNLKGIEGRARKREEAAEAASTGFSGLLAPPPPSSSQSRRQQTSTQLASVPPPAVSQPLVQQAIVQQPHVSQDDLFADFEDFQSAAESRASVAHTVPPASHAKVSTDLRDQFEQLSLGGALSQPSAQQPTLTSQYSAPFAAPAQQRPLKQGSDPFDEFDIFK